MTRHFNSCIDSDFLQAFLAMKSKFDPEQPGNTLEVWRSLLKFYREKSELDLFLKNINLEKLTYDPDYSFLAYLLNKHTQKDPSIRISNFDNEKAASVSKNSHFVFELDDELASVCKKHGVPHAQAKDAIKLWENFYRTSTIAIPSGDENTVIGWEGLGIIPQPCNAMIISDNYLLSNKWNIDNTILPILNVFLPKDELEIRFDLTIFSSKFYINPNDDSLTIQEIEKVFDALLNKIDINLNLRNINLTIVQKKLNEFHDRHIYTNNFVLKSGNSFTYFGRGGKAILPSATTLDINPLPADNKGETYADTYSEFLGDLKMIMNKSQMAVGSKQNRLFDNIK